MLPTDGIDTPEHVSSTIITVIHGKLTMVQKLLLCSRSAQPSKKTCTDMAAPVIVGQLVAVVVDPEHVQHVAGGVGGDVRLEHHHIRLPQRVHQVCATGNIGNSRYA